MLSKEEISQRFMSLQDAICTAVEKEDAGALFLEDKWSREEGGGGRTRIIQKGKVIEKGGVLFSAVHGNVPDFLSKENAGAKGQQFYATGVSIVMHPLSPMVPIIHMNVRYFEMSNGTWWFGGGIDLTPHYVNPGDAQFFHKELRSVCDRHDVSYYAEFKKWADDYFYLPHRQETRGIGGIFFDRQNNKSKEDLFAFIMELGNLFAPVYTSLMHKHKSEAYTEDQKKWQLLRRGRYVEFNLLYDKGTKFGLETNGRTESILMSLPQTASWEYNFSPVKGSPEEQTLALLKKGIDWVK